MICRDFLKEASKVVTRSLLGLVLISPAFAASIGAFSVVQQVGGDGYFDSAPGDLYEPSETGFTYLPAAFAFGGGDDGSAWVSSNIAQGAVRMEASMDYAYPELYAQSGGDPGLLVQGGFIDVVTFDFGGLASASLSFSGYLDAQISGDAIIEYTVLLQKCSDSSCDGSKTNIVNIFEEYTSDISMNLIFDNGGDGYWIDSGASYYLDFRISGKLGDGGSIDAKDTFALDLVLPENSSFSSQSGILFSEDLVSPVPIPAAAWLFASALGIFGYLGKRKANA